MKTTHLCYASLVLTAGLLSGCMHSVAVEEPNRVNVKNETPSANAEQAPSVSEGDQVTRSVSEGEPPPPPATETPLVDQVAVAEPAPKPAAEEKPKPADAAPATRPKADRTPRKPGDPIRITFDHIILGMQADMVFRPWMLSDEVKDLDGQKVSITGVIYGNGLEKQQNLKDFVLLRNKECKFGKGGQADHLAKVEMKKGEVIDYTIETVRVEGTLRIKPETGNDGNTWSLYILEDATAKVQK